MQPKGFWSYARGDDDYLAQLLSGLRQRISGEISALLGEDIGMFQDVYDIRTGHDWEEKLRTELTEASFLVPVLTPRFFRREWCREEVMTFIALAGEVGRKPLIFPIYFITDKPYDRGEHDELRAAVARFQYLDFRTLRFETDPTRRDKVIHGFASDVIDRLEEVTGAVPPRRPAPEVENGPRPEPARAPECGQESDEYALPPAPPQPEIPRIVVDQFPGRGNFETIADAIREAAPGAQILVRPGRYYDKLVIDKPIELIGEGPAEDIVIDVAAGNPLVVSASIARVSGLTLRRTDGAGRDAALWVTGGRASFHDCDISSEAQSAVIVSGAGTAPLFRRCRMCGSAQSGLVVLAGARPRLEDCELSDNRVHGLMVRESDPTIRHCVLRGNGECGILVEVAGRGQIAECEIQENGKDGITALGGGSPVVRDCNISRNRSFGINIADEDSGGVFEENQVVGNGRGAWCAEGSQQKLIRRDNREQ